MIEPATTGNPIWLERRLVPVLVLCIVTILALLVVFTGEGWELTPRHEGDESLALAISIGMGILCFVAMVRVRPQSWQQVLLALGWAAGTGFVCCPVAGIVLERMHEIADFHGRGIVERQLELPIVTASIHRYRGVSYHVWLKDDAALVTVDRGDYLAAFGAVESIRPQGYCVRATVQTAGAASRIMAPPGRALSAGSLGRCGIIAKGSAARPLSADEAAAWTRALATPAPATPAAPAPPSATIAPRS